MFFFVYIHVLVSQGWDLGEDDELCLVRNDAANVIQELNEDRVLFLI